MSESELLVRLDAWVREHVEAQERGLFPALIESMAGSDAVCVRGLTADAVSEHRALEAALRRAASGHVSAEEVRARCADHLAGEQAELLPMAARLLDAELVEGWSSAQRLGAAGDG